MADATGAVGATRILEEARNNPRESSPHLGWRASIAAWMWRLERAAHTCWVASGSSGIDVRRDHAPDTI
ncbi:MAG TPA: hypothetical protein VF808_14820 [Ktedonobacterales bacterium]